MKIASMYFFGFLFLFLVYDMFPFYGAYLIGIQRKEGAEIAAQVFRTYYDRNRGFRAARSILGCDDVACISEVLGELDRHIRFYPATDAKRLFSGEKKSPNDTNPIIEIESDIAHVGISTFAFYDKKDWRNFFAILKHDLSNKIFKEVVIDLRGNQGGDLEAAILTSSLFIKKATHIGYPKRNTMVTTYLGRRVLPSKIIFNGLLRPTLSELNQEDFVVGKCQAEKITIFIDGKTASSAEVVGFLIKNHSSAKVEIRGDEPSFGVLNSVRNNERLVFFQGSEYFLGLPQGKMEKWPSQLIPDY